MRRKFFVPVLVIVLVVALSAIGYVIASGTVNSLMDGGLSLRRNTCEVTESETTLSFKKDQAMNIATIAAIGVRRKLPQRAIEIAIATAMQESKLQNLPDGHADSIGLFQQRPSQGWGTRTQLKDPVYATEAFYTHLVKVPRWRELRVTEAAQAVQRSAYPELYEQWSDEATILANSFAGNLRNSVTCYAGVTAQKSITPTDQTKLIKAGVAELGIRFPVIKNHKSKLYLLKPTRGWQVSYWLVAHSHEFGVTDVSYDGSRWNSHTGTWDQTAIGKGLLDIGFA